MTTREDADLALRDKARNAAMKVSVVIPVYNELAFIEEILLRVQAQQLNKEILVIDDGSTDGTDQLVARYAREYAWIQLVTLPEIVTRLFASYSAAKA